MRVLRVTSALVALLGIGLGLSACAGSTPSAADAAAPSTAAAPAPGNPLVTVAPGASSTARAAPGAVRTIDIVMTDFAFAPATIEVKAGETVAFHFVNKGVVMHEAVIGDAAQQAGHGAAMAAAASTAGETGAPAADHSHHAHEAADTDATPNTDDTAAEMLQVAVGEDATVTRTFLTRGQLSIGCHQPGHYEAGMKATIMVT